MLKSTTNTGLVFYHGDNWLKLSSRDHFCPIPPCDGQPPRQPQGTPLPGFAPYVVASHTVLNFIRMTKRIWQEWCYVTSKVRTWKTGPASPGSFALEETSWQVVERVPRGEELQPPAHSQGREPAPVMCPDDWRPINIWLQPERALSQNYSARQLPNPQKPHKK